MSFSYVRLPGNKAKVTCLCGWEDTPMPISPFDPYEALAAATSAHRRCAGTPSSIYQPAAVQLALISSPNGAACQRLLADNCALFSTVQGSTHNHQNWRGGYLDHVTEVMNIACVLYQAMRAKRPLAFTLSDILLVVFLHDVEKPWKYELGPDGQLQHKASMLTKAAHQRFRVAKIAEYGIQLTPEHENALQYAEGELDDYSPRERRMGPLAALAHMCDVASARIWFDYPAATDDPWQGAERSAQGPR